MNVPLILHPNQHELKLVLLILAILTGLKWNSKVVLVYISMMAKKVDFFFLSIKENISSWKATILEACMVSSSSLFHL